MPAQLADPNYVKAGAVLPDMESFDAAFFGFSPREAAIMDPQHRHFLECAWEALENAGHVPERFDGAIGVFGGSGHNAYLPLQPADQSGARMRRSASSCCATPATTRTS